MQYIIKKINKCWCCRFINYNYNYNASANDQLTIINNNYDYDYQFEYQTIQAVSQRLCAKWIVPKQESN